MSILALNTLHKTTDGREVLILSGRGGKDGWSHECLFLDCLQNVLLDESEVIEVKRARLVWDSTWSRPAKNAPQEWVGHYQAHWRWRHLESAVDSLEREKIPFEERWAHRPDVVRSPSFADVHHFTNLLASLWGPPSKSGIGSLGFWGHPPREDVRAAWLRAYETDLPSDADLEAAMAVYVVDREAEWERWQARWAEERRAVDDARKARELEQLRETVEAGAYKGPDLKAALFEVAPTQLPRRATQRAEKVAPTEPALVQASLF